MMSCGVFCGTVGDRFLAGPGDGVDRAAGQSDLAGCDVLREVVADLQPVGAENCVMAL
jgi:hypothetical protein